MILNSSIKFIDEHSMESDEDQRVVDHLSPQTLLETPADSEVHYSFRSPEGNAFFLISHKKQYCFIRIVALSLLVSYLVYKWAKMTLMINI